jgi:hypothetical protein
LTSHWTFADRGAWFLTVLGAVGALSCGSPAGPSDGSVCTTEARAGIVVEIRDKANAQPLAYWAQATVRSGSYTESLMPGQFLDFRDPQTMVSRIGAFERAGTYSVEVTAPGFKDVRFEGVTVLSEPCHVRGVNLSALLELAP